MGWGGSADVQHSSLCSSEPFLAFLALFCLGLQCFFDAERPAVSGSGCGGMSYLTKTPHMMIHMWHQ